MEQTWIEDFLALCQTQHFTRAAERRCTTQSAFSRRIQRFEEWLGVALVDRSSAGFVLTPAGSYVLRHLPNLSNEIEELRRGAQSLSSHFEKPTRIYTTNMLAARFLPRWLCVNPPGPGGLALHVASAPRCLEALRQAEADRIFIPYFSSAPYDEPYTVSTVATDFLRPMMHQKAHETLRLQKGQLLGPFLAYAPGTFYAQQLSALFTSHHISFAAPPVCESFSSEALLALVEAGMGVAWLPGLYAHESLVRCRLPKAFDIPYKILSISR